MLRTHALRLAALSLLASSLLLSCKKSPSAPESTSGEAQGTYYSFASFAGEFRNIRLMVESDTSDDHAFSGAITYGGITSTLAEARTNTDADSLYFSYVRSSVLHRVASRITDSAVNVTYLEPAEQPTYRANRALKGYNMTGIWPGRIASAAWGVEDDATLTMDQQGQFFYGTTSATLFQAFWFEFDFGIADSAHFEIGGTVRVGDAVVPTLFWGTYVGSDTLSGLWQAGAQGEIDHGSFYYIRTFD